MPQGAGRDNSLRHQVSVLRRRWPVVVLLAGLCCGTAVWLTRRQAPVYRATASVLLQANNGELIIGGPPGSFGGSGNEAATEIEVMRSQVVRDAVAAKLGRDPEVDIEARGVTDVIDINATSEQPAVAASEATTFAEVYVELRRTQRVDDLLKTGELIQAQIVDLDRRIDELEKPLRDLDARLGATADPKVRPLLQQQREAAADAISADRRTLEARRSSFDDQLNRLQLLKGLGISGGVQVVSKADVPTDPISATPLRNGALGLGGGLVLGVALAFLLDQADDRLRRREELEELARVPVLGLLPLVGRRHLQKDVVTLRNPASAAAEAFRTLRTSLQFLGVDRPITCIQVTSPTASEGKTTVVTNLAASFAQGGQRVIVLDCDLRRPRVHESFGLPNEAGFTSVLLDQVPLADAIVTLADEPFLAILPSGPIPPNPSELLNSNRAQAVIASLRENCDILLIDTPPVLPVTDAAVVSRFVDATLLVARPKRSTKRQVVRACELLERVGAPLVGAVLNGVVHEVGDGYGSGYVGYVESSARKPRAKRGGRRGEPGTGLAPDAS